MAEEGRERRLASVCKERFRPFQEGFQSEDGAGLTTAPEKNGLFPEAKI